MFLVFTHDISLKFYTQVIERAGAQMVAMDLATQKIYFVKDYTMIVEDSLVGPSNPTTIVDDIYSVGDMVYDPRFVI